jgi:hypothetical protein
LRPCKYTSGPDLRHLRLKVVVDCDVGKPSRPHSYGIRHAELDSMVDKAIAPYLPAEMWECLGSLTDHIAALPVPEYEHVALIRGLQTLTDKLVLISKQHNLTYPTGD